MTYPADACVVHAKTLSRILNATRQWAHIMEPPRLFLPVGRQTHGCARSFPIYIPCIMVTITSWSSCRGAPSLPATFHRGIIANLALPPNHPLFVLHPAARVFAHCLLYLCTILRTRSIDSPLSITPPGTLGSLQSAETQDIEGYRSDRRVPGIGLARLVLMPYNDTVSVCVASSEAGLTHPSRTVPNRS